jgi:sulfite reductase (NADPH) flavoprotein alpha-component
MKESHYNRTNPFLASIKARYNLCAPGAKKETHHLILDLKNSGIRYHVGDSLGVYPKNDPKLVENTLSALNAQGTEIVHDRQGNNYNLRQYLSTKANISEFSRKLLQEIHERQGNPIKKASIAHLLKDENREDLENYQNKHELWQLLADHLEVTFAPQEFCSLLMPLLPRFYSIASSQRVVGDEVHLTVARVVYPQENGYLRRGVCTHYLCELVPLNEPSVPIFIQPHRGFTLPEDHSKPVIMVGPGTGVAPFRAFMQERLALNAPGENWLFFGEWHQNHNYLYGNEWQTFETQKKLRINLAFSRDQNEKVYVQHRMYEYAEELFDWIHRGAVFYVCGDAKQMARDVDAMLLRVIQEKGNLDDQGAKNYLKELRAENRYLRDVY